MMDLRSNPGEVLDKVAVHGNSFVIERNGQKKAFLVPISVFQPDIPSKRLSQELDKLTNAEERFRISITENKEFQIIFTEKIENQEIGLIILLPHGYPNKAPVIKADPIEQSTPHRWLDGSLCIFGAMETWNPGQHDLIYTLKLSRRWLRSYSLWLNSGNWPRQEEIY